MSMTASTATPAQRTTGQKVGALFLQYGMVWALILLVIVGSFVYPRLLTLINIRNFLSQSAPVGIVAVGMTFVTLSGNFVSLGITQSAMLAMVAFVAMLGAGWGVVPAVIVVILLLVAVGMLQGAIIAAGLNPVITTLAAGAIIFGVVSELTRGGIVRAGENAIDWDQASIAGVPVEVLIFILFTALVTFVMQRTVTGRETTLIGANRATAEISGISFTRVTILAFAIFSVGLALAGIINGAAFGQATAVSFPGLTVDAIAAVLVGGTAIQGGRGSPLRSAGGAVLIAIISNMMVLNDFSTGGRLAVQGGVVVVIVVLLDLLRRSGGRRS